MHTIAPEGYRNGQVRSHLIVDVLCHPKSALKARARANGTGQGQGPDRINAHRGEYSALRGEDNILR